MYYDRLSRRVHLEIGGKEHLLALTISGLEQLESVTNETIMEMFAKFSRSDVKITNLISVFWIALRNGDKKNKDLSRAEAEELAAQYFEEHSDADEANGGSFGSFLRLCIGLIAISGILGAKARNNALQGLGLIDKDEEEADTKNAVTPPAKKTAAKK